MHVSLPWFHPFTAPVPESEDRSAPHQIIMSRLNPTAAETKVQPGPPADGSAAC